ncbi:trypsin-1 [Folsomia candida]|uniref:Trypsin-1 n=1 Tax=Folsomia candida TaxID=158441 RepID=A0A226DFQ9_FOLCA|nr:trypsin-1 [Folsomia candida]OXA43818.1 Trypsin-1 [Folsomia candida]
MQLRTITQLLVGLGIVILLFKLESTWAYMPRVPASIASTVGKQFLNPGDRIVGGRFAVHGEFPYQASIQRLSILGTKVHYCGGALVGQCIVTAAHCLEGRKERDLLVRLGSVSLWGDQLSQEYYVDKLIIHPTYDAKTIVNDIGILKLNRKVEFGIGIKEVPLPIFKSEIEPDTQCILSGWGSQKEGGSVSKGLMCATVPTMTDDKCREFYGKSEIFDTMLCAGYSEGGVDSCQGDSGGGLVCDGQLRGIVSWGVGCARPQFPGVYTEVSYYTKWIESLDCFKPKNFTEPTVPGKFFTFNFPFWKNNN